MIQSVAQLADESLTPTRPLYPTGPFGRVSGRWRGGADGKAAGRWRIPAQQAERELAKGECRYRVSPQ
eukprot:scaffold250979_cov49-Prasinocladus_malaysianus.AAC.2